MKIEEFYEAEHILKDVIKPTPLVETKISEKHQVYLKPECNQVTGSFKIRGAYYKISCLSDEEKANGIITCSAGNHAQGVALACQKLGIKAHICMPKTTPKVKVENTRAYGAEVILVDGVYDDAYIKALELEQLYGYTFIHPFNDEQVIIGQGTISLEILEELKTTTYIVCPIGGGGLIAGVAVAAKKINPKIHIIGVEPTGALGMYKSLSLGMRVDLIKVNTIAEGAAVKSVGAITFKYVQKYVDDIFTVTEDDIKHAIKFAYDNYGLVLEGAGALSLAAALNYDFARNKGPQTIVCILSGGNIDKELFDEINKG